MAEFKTIYNKGINQDANKENYPNGFYINLENGRLITDEGNSDFNISTPKGNEVVALEDLTYNTFPTKGVILGDIVNDNYHYLSVECIEDISTSVISKTDMVTYITNLSDWSNVIPIGSCNINNDLILFTRLFTTTTDTNNLGVWRLTSNGQKTGGATVTIKNVVYQLQLIYIHENSNEYTSSEQIKIEAVGYYESTRIQNVYWADEQNSLRKLNITEPGIFLKNRGLVDVITEANIDPPKFIDINTNGQLYVGQAQYACRYFIPNGQQSYFGLPSPLIHLTEFNEKSNTAGRQYKGSTSYDTNIIDNTTVSTTTLKNSTKSITIEIENIDDRYEYIEIVRIHYVTLDADPTITSVYQGKFTTGFQFTDYGSTSLANYSLAQYRLFNIDFIPKTIAIKDNILFAGNIQEKYFSSNNWDSFDTRAFRFDSGGSSRIYEATDEQEATPKDNDSQHRITGSGFSTIGYYENNIQVGSSFDISTKQDINAINRFNNINLTPNQEVDPFTSTTPTYQYRYQSDGTTVGGEGPNIKYEFITKELTISEKEYLVPGTVRESDQFIIDSKNNKDDLNIGPDNYGSPYNSAYYKQYKRNEIYRFALVVFDKKGTPSKPKWIGDIRTPVTTKNSLTDNNFDIVVSSYNGTTDTCKANALGLSFIVDFNGSSIEDGIGGYAIVRCNRDENRTNLGQGLLGNMRSTSIPGSAIGDGGGNCLTYDQVSASSNALWYTPGVIDFEYGVPGSYIWNYDRYDRYEWVSPEASFNNNLISFSNSYMQAMGSCQTDPTHGYLGVFKYKLWESTTVSNDWGIDSTLAASGGGACRMSMYYDTVERTWIKSLDDAITFQYFNSFSSLIGDSLSTPSSLYEITSSILDGKRLTPGETALAGNSVISMSCSYGGGNRQLCGPGMYFQLDEKPLPNTGSINGWNNQHNYWLLTDYIRAAIPYGGYEYTPRELNSYQFCDSYVAINNHSDTASFNVFGGDTFIGYYQHVRSTTAKEKYDTGYTDLNTGVITFPCESTINLNLRHDSYIPTYSNNFNINMYGEARPDDGPSCFSVPGTLQLEDLYLYNSVFSKSNSSYIIQNALSNDNKGSIFNTKVLASQKKYLGEFIDSWTKFGANEFLELDTAAGELNKLISHKDGVYALQSEGIAKLAINEKSTIQDDTGQSIVLGTGGVLPYATYITKDSGTRHKWSVVSTPEIVWYYDSNNNTLNHITSSNGAVSDVKGLFKLMSKFDLYKLNDVSAVYDPKYREIVTSFDFSSALDNVDSDGISIVFNDKLKSFVSTRHQGVKYKPFMYYQTPELLFSAKRTGKATSNISLFTHNVGEYNTWFNEYNPLKLTLLLNPFKDKVTILDSLEFNSLVINPDSIDQFDKIIHDETITSIRVYNDLQDTGVVDLTTQNARNQLWIRRLVRKWRYNYLRNNRADANPNGSSPRLRNYFFIVEITFDRNTSTPRYFELGNIVSYYRNITTTQL